jgi:beta-glucanase (GH16 family)
MERFGNQSPFNEYSTVWHSQDPSKGSNCQVEKGGVAHNNPPALTSYRKYAMEWHPGKFVMYFEGEPIWEIRDPVHVPTSLSQTILNFAIDGHVNANTVFPAYYDIDYIKIYQLKTDCNANFAICNFNPNTYDYKVKKSISIGGSGCTSNISTNHTVAFRATDSIEFKEGTTITASGAGWFFADVIPCPQ